MGIGLAKRSCAAPTRAATELYPARSLRQPRGLMKREKKSCASASSLLHRAQPVADAPDGLDGLAQWPQFLTQPQDSIIDRAIAANIRFAPDGIQQICAAERASRTAQQQM